MLKALLDKRLLLPLLAGTAVIGLSACSDSTSEIISEGETDQPGGQPPAPPPPAPPSQPPGSATSCPEGTSLVQVTVDGEDIGQCELSGIITTDVTLSPDFDGQQGVTYTLDGAVFIGEDGGINDAANPDAASATLTIEAGTQIYGQTTDAILVIARGSQIQVNGAQSNPVVMTSAEDLGFAAAFGRTQRDQFRGFALDDPNSGEWGGLIINGQAPINTCDFAAGNVCETEGEGSTGTYGGDEPDDSSGSIEFLQVRYAGFEITTDNELNGIAFQGVGRGTNLDFIQVHNNDDDGVEFFGGTAQAKHIVLTGEDDDSMDWTQGWQGRVQYVLVLQNPNQPGSDQGYEGDNLEQNNDFSPRAAPIVSNATLVGRAADQIGDIGMLIREGSAGQFVNHVVVDFTDACLDLDDTATFDQADPASSSANAELRIESTLFDCANIAALDSDGTEEDDVPAGFGGDGTIASWFLAGSNNVSTASSLSGLFINGSAESSVAAVDPTSFDSFFDGVDFIGAVPQDAGSSFDPQGNWTVGWTFGVNPDPECPNVDGITPLANGSGCLLESGTLTGDITLQQGLDYVIEGGVFVGDDLGPDPENLMSGDSGTLTIDAGVTLYGVNPDSRLVVSRGSRIDARGTSNAPVVFTACRSDVAACTDAAPDETFELVDVFTSSGLWGGLIINGRAPINTCDFMDPGSICETTGEGSSGEYGGATPDDNSGSLRFVRVEFAGFEITTDNELNGIAFQGVGSGTVIDSVQVHNNDDDGIEFFGGTANAKRLVLTGADDDSLDWTQGWTGKVQFIVIVQNPNQPDSDQGYEGDNLEQNNDFLPRAMPLISNSTIIGQGDDQIGDIGMLIREGSAGVFWNHVVTNFADACLDLDDDATFNQADPASAGAMGADLRIVAALFDCADAMAVFDEEVGDPFDISDWFDAEASNSKTVSNTLSPPARGGTSFVNGSAENDPMRAVDPSMVDPFFESTDFLGAVPNAQAGDFTAGWTIFLDTTEQEQTDAGTP